MARYDAPHSLAAAANKPQICLGSDGAALIKLTKISVGSIGTPADLKNHYRLLENTDMGTGGSAITPKVIGPGPASVITAKGGTFGADPTTTGVGMASIEGYQRIRGFEVRGLDDAWSPAVVAANRGLGLWCSVAADVTSWHSLMEWFE